MTNKKWHLWQQNPLEPNHDPESAKESGSALKFNYFWLSSFNHINTNTNAINYAKLMYILCLH